MHSWEENALSSSDFFTIEQSTGGQSASNPLQEQERNRMEDLRFERHQPDNMHPSYLLRDESKAVRQPQRRLNPHMQEVVRVEVLKLL